MRRQRRNPGRGAELLFTIAATVASSLITLAIVAMLDRQRTAALSTPVPQPIAPGHGSA